MQATGHAVSQHKLESNAMLGATYHNSAVWHDGETFVNSQEQAAAPRVCVQWHTLVHTATMSVCQS